ncbi:homoserine O-acetyltransferase [Rhizoctonia solani AG-1 IB]|uniref:Homoserine O-acetyltransferase n=1 Tax=Thanatephorus cucumeris (strain AG1-IB / isolate 7/3/14) TaxID=1108050 RepID=A0A0B7F2M0_THACB|nr:homoserine O-acetyltransferase [Rhizoctonia solani AG-1 IB]
MDKNTGTPYTHLVDNQNYEIIPSFDLECGRVLRDVPVAYKTFGKLNAERDNVMIICHAFTGSADVEDWWGPLVGHGKAFDPHRFFIFCGNVLGSPYGSASPLTIDPETREPYGPEFPITTIRDDVRIHKLVLDKLGVRSVAVVVGGSMGGMAVLEWPLCTPPGFIRNIIPIATSARHSAWCISWGEAQRQSIYSDPLYADGYYAERGQKPTNGLAAARMAALLTYRSRDSFEGRFGRRPQISRAKDGVIDRTITPPKTPADEALAYHNDGNKSASRIKARSTKSVLNAVGESLVTNQPPKIFTAQSYLRYQGDKFNSRFDANCYIHITRKLDTHDLGRGRGKDDEAENDTLISALSQLPRGALVIGIESDGLFMPSEQREIAAHIPEAQLVLIPSPDGHDGFLLEFEVINEHIVDFLKKKLPSIYEGDVAPPFEGAGEFGIKKTSTFGEAEADVDVTRW